MVLMIMICTTEWLIKNVSGDYKSSAIINLKLILTIKDKCDKLYYDWSMNTKDKVDLLFIMIPTIHRATC